METKLDPNKPEYPTDMQAKDFFATVTVAVAEITPVNPRMLAVIVLTPADTG